MDRNNNPSTHPVILIFLFLIGVFTILGAVRLISGKSLGLRSFVTDRIGFGVNSIQLLWNSPNITRDNRGEFTNIIFLHHSTGNNLVQQGGVREKFSQSGYSFWDHYRNAQGLRGPDKTIFGLNYKVPGDNTDPDGLTRIFSQKIWPIPLNTMSALLQHEVIIIKSCFEPANNLRSDTQLEMYKQYYVSMRNTIDQHPDRIFIILTTPPLNPAQTNSEEARRARAYADWLKSDEFLTGHPNLYIFDFYDLLAEDDPENPEVNMLRAKYRDGSDSHPNKTANEVIGPLFVDFVIEKAQKYRSESE